MKLWYKYKCVSISAFSFRTILKLKKFSIQDGLEFVYIHCIVSADTYNSGCISTKGITSEIGYYICLDK